MFITHSQGDREFQEGSGRFVPGFEWSLCTKGGKMELRRQAGKYVQGPGQEQGGSKLEVI